MTRCFRVVLVLLIAAAGCRNAHDLGPPPAHSAVNDWDKRNTIAPPPALVTIGNLAGPESVLYDPDQDVYFISNINGGLLDRDNNGFITRVDAKTMKVNLKWVEAGKNNVALDGPKGMAIAGDSLYVSDVTAVRRFDRRTGAPQASIALPGATLINDLTSDGTNVFASDTGVVPGAGETFSASGTDAIWKISGDRAAKIAAGTDLGQPNGLCYTDGRLWVVTFRGNELYRLDGGSRKDIVKLPHEQLDGLVVLSGGRTFVTSWKGACVYAGRTSGGFEPLLQAVPTPADIGYDTHRHLLLLPASSLNRVTVHPVM